MSQTNPSPAEQLLGPVDYLLLEFPLDRLTGAVVPELVDLVSAGVIRIYDLRVIVKHADGRVAAMEVRDSPLAQDFAYFDGAASGLLDEDDVDEAAQAMEPGKVAALLVYENTWASRFVQAARRSGGEVIAGGRIPAEALIETLDRLEAEEDSESVVDALQGEPAAAEPSEGTGT